MPRKKARQIPGSVGWALRAIHLTPPGIWRALRHQISGIFTGQWFAGFVDKFAPGRGTIRPKWAYCALRTETRWSVGRNSVSRIAPCHTLRLRCAMPNYRRIYVPGGCYFFTVNLLDRPSRLLVDHIGHLRDAVRDTHARFPFVIDAMVILPDHLHAVWTLPPGDADFSVRWRWIKIRFSRVLPLPARLDPVRLRSGFPGFAVGGVVSDQGRRSRYRSAVGRAEAGSPGVRGAGAGEEPAVVRVVCPS